MKYVPIPEVFDENAKPLFTPCSVKIPILLGRFHALLEFIVCDNVAVPAILGTEFCDRFVESIRPRKGASSCAMSLQYPLMVDL